MAIRNYLPRLSIIVKTLCRYLVKHRALIDAAVAAGTSPANAAIVKNFLDSAQSACAVLEAITGY